MTAVMSAPQSSAVDRWLATFRRIAPTLPGAGTPWLAELRRRAIARFAEMGWPSSKLEQWRHTSLLFLDKEAFEPVKGRGGNAAADDAELQRMVRALRADTGDHWYVFVDGRFMTGLSRPGVMPEGVQAGTLSQALAESPESLQASFGDGERCEAPAALNAALAADGAVIRLAPGVALAEPIHLVFVSATAGSAIHVRNLVTAGRGARATVVEHYLGLDPSSTAEPANGGAKGGGLASDSAAATSMTNVVTRIALGEDAHVIHVKLQQEAPAAVHLAAVDVVQARGSQFQSHSMSFGARLARNDIATRFAGEGCEALLNGLYHVDGRRHVDHHTRIDHAQPRGTSREFYRGILDDAGRGVFTGRIHVAPGAVRTDAVQRTDSLLLSARAETDARPELEIYADDVKCAHGATVGQIDEAGLFYLRSRGIDEADARNMLTFAFAGQALARIESPALRRRAEAAIRSRLPGGEAMEVMS